MKMKYRNENLGRLLVRFGEYIEREDFLPNDYLDFIVIQRDFNNDKITTEAFVDFINTTLERWEK